MSDDSSSSEENYPDLKLIPEYDIRNIRSYLSPSRQKMLDDFRASLPQLLGRELTPLEQYWADDACLCRYLRARDWKFEKAQKLIAETFEWRRTYRPYAITCEDVKTEMDNEGKLYINGYDKYNRPVIYMKPGKDNTGGEVRDIKVKYLVYLLEKCAQYAAERGREKFTIIIDFKNFSSLTGVSNIKTSKEVVNVLLNHYPERLGACFMVNCSYSFVFFWKIMQPFLDEVTKSKISVVSDTKILLDYIDVDQLEVDYGGNNTFQWDFESCWRREDERWPPWTETHFGPQAQAQAQAKSKKSRKKKKKKKNQDGDDSTATD